MTRLYSPHTVGWLTVSHFIWSAVALLLIGRKATAKQSSLTCRLLHCSAQSIRYVVDTPAIFTPPRRRRRRSRQQQQQQTNDVIMRGNYTAGGGGVSSRDTVAPTCLLPRTLVHRQLYLSAAAANLSPFHRIVRSDRIESQMHMCLD